MQVLLDSRPLEAAGTLGQMIDAAHEALADSGRLVVEVRLDGQLLDAATLDAKMDEPIEAEKVELLTADPGTLAQETLGQVAAALDAIRDQQVEAASLLRSDQAQAALDQVREALEVWQQAQMTVMQSAQLLSIDLDQQTVSGEPASVAIERLASHLRELREQLTGSDWLGLADTLEYDLTEAAEQWTALIGSLQQAIADRGAGEPPEHG